ncbi:CueP family metal-binding protein [Bacillus sp. A116_S68]|nr:CueP family metal-binding protein [Bacillus sp. A116_S68]
MKLKLITAFGLAAIISVVYLVISSTGDNRAVEEKNEQAIIEMVHEYSTTNEEDETASITPTELIITDSNDQEVIYDLVGDDFFVSIAPYVEETHPCTYHNLTGCQGEMIEEEFDIYIENTKGEVIVDESLTSLANGFIDLWLPREETYYITIEHNGKTVDSEFSTFEDDATCITTMQLL